MTVRIKRNRHLEKVSLRAEFKGQKRRTGAGAAADTDRSPGWPCQQLRLTGGLELQDWPRVESSLKEQQPKLWGYL